MDQPQDQFKVGDYVVSLNNCAHSAADTIAAGALLLVTAVESPPLDSIPICVDLPRSDNWGWYSPNALRHATDAEILEYKLTL